ncbi:MAG: diguanylate cyclase [Acidobacteriota bacterium]
MPDADDAYTRVLELARGLQDELDSKQDEIAILRRRIDELEAAPTDPRRDPLARRVRELEAELERSEDLRHGQEAALVELRRRLGDTPEDQGAPGSKGDLMARLMVSEWMRSSQMQNLQYLQGRLDELESQFHALASLVEAPTDSGVVDPRSLLQQVAEKLTHYERERVQQQGTIDRLSRSLAVQQVDDTLDDAQSRRNVLRRMDDALGWSRRHGSPLACLLVGIDDAETLREREGSVTYDYVLVKVAERLRLALRQSDVLLRHDGQSFVLLTSAATTTDAYTHAQRLVADVAASPVDLGATRVQPSISVAVVVLHGAIEDGDGFLRRARGVLTRARAGGAGQVAVDPQSVAAEQAADG